jgi:hypothetical protein
MLTTQTNLGKTPTKNEVQLIIEEILAAKLKM